jgi:hypothetical protein
MRQGSVAAEGACNVAGRRPTGHSDRERRAPLPGASRSIKK